LAPGPAPPRASPSASSARRSPPSCSAGGTDERTRRNRHRHAPLPALDAALARIEELDVDQIYCGGDLVGYGPHPNEVCAAIEAHAIPTIYGNYDYAIGRDLDDCGCAYINPHDRKIGQLSVDWTLAHTNQQAKDFMRELPFDLRFELAGKRVRLVHGSPRKVNEYLFEDKPARTFGRIAALADCDVLVFGHTHKPWMHEYGGVLFVNCGSVGKPKDGDARAAFALFQAQGDDLSTTIERVDYDALAVAREMRNAGLPEELAESSSPQPDRRAQRFGCSASDVADRERLRLHSQQKVSPRPVPISECSHAVEARSGESVCSSGFARRANGVRLIDHLLRTEVLDVLNSDNKNPALRGF
jgi:putative phosphoesterase